jgi:adenylate cyclase
VRAYRFGEFELRPDERLLTRAGSPVRLGARAFDLLVVLVDDRNRVVDKGELLDRVWPGLVVEEANLSVHVSALRKALGARALSTVPGRGYRFVLPVVEADGDATGSDPPIPVPDCPSIAVMPFEDLSGPGKRDAFADGLVEDLVTTLSKLSGLTVVSRARHGAPEGLPADPRRLGRELGVRYVLEGSVRTAGARMRIAVRLLDAESGAHLWAERYDRALEDIFALQDEITLIVVTELQVRLTEGEQARLRNPSIRGVEAWSHWARGIACYRRAVLSREGMTPALMSWQRAAALEPDSATLQAMLGMLYYLDARFGFWNGRDTALSKALAHVDRAFELDAQSADAHMVVGLLSLLQRRHVEAVASARRSLEFGPGSADVAAFASFVFANSGLGRDAVALIERAVRLYPTFPPFYLGHMGLAYRQAGQVDAAVAAFEAYDRASPGRGVTDLAIIHEQRGETDVARAWTAKLLGALPDFTLRAWLATQFRSDAQGVLADLGSLRTLGVPE